MNFKLKNTEDLGGEADIYTLQTSALAGLGSGNTREVGWLAKWSWPLEFSLCHDDDAVAPARGGGKANPSIIMAI